MHLLSSLSFGTPLMVLCFADSMVLFECDASLSSNYVEIYPIVKAVELVASKE